MPDRDIVAAIVAGDPAGLSAAYDSYAAGLFGYCRSLLGEPADAADAVQDTFVIAAAKVGGLRNPARLRSWLYAVARNECHGRLRARARLADLDGSDLAGVLGVPVNQAHALASRARSQLERALGALLVARTGRRDCIELDAILDSWDGKLTVLWRKRVSRHIEDCDICVARKREVLSPAMLLSVLPLAPLPAGLRQHLMRLVSDHSPEAIGYRGRVVSRAGAFDQAGFPRQMTPLAPAGRSGRFPGAGGAGGSGAGGAGPDGGGGGRHHAGERSMLVLLAAAAAVILLLGGGVATTYALLAGGGHAKTGPHHRSAAGAISIAATSSAPAALPPSPPSVAPSPSPAGAPTTPAAHSSAPLTPPPAKSSGPAKSSPASSPSASSSETTVPVPPPPTTSTDTAPPSSTASMSTPTFGTVRESHHDSVGVTVVLYVLQWI